MFKFVRRLFSKPAAPVEVRAGKPASDMPADSSSAIMAEFAELLLFGGARVSINGVRELVHKHPEQAARFAIGVLETEDLPRRASAQRARVVGEMLREELGDDSFLEYVRFRLTELSFHESLGIGIEAPAVVLPPDALVHLNIERSAVERNDVSAITNALSSVEDFRAYRGRCFLGFPYDNDPREVWEIPECREFVATLHKRMPHFPYVLWGGTGTTLFAYLACLAPQSALAPPVGINLYDENVFTTLVDIALAVRSFADRAGDDWRKVLAQLFQTLPEELLAQLLAEDS